MQRRSFLQLAGAAVLGVLVSSEHSLWTRISDRFFYRPWTDEELADRVAWMMAHASHARNWGRPVEAGPPVTGQLGHSFTFLTTAEVEQQLGRRHGA